MHPVSTSTNKAYQWGDGAIGWSLVETKGLLVIEETLAPGCGEKRKYHNQAEQCFYMLSGCAVMQVSNDQNVEINAGMALHIPPETCHAIVKQISEEIRFLVISAPSSHSDRHEVEQDK